jgi:hypothetical protein
MSSVAETRGASHALAASIGDVSSCVDRISATTAEVAGVAANAGGPRLQDRRPTRFRLASAATAWLYRPPTRRNAAKITCARAGRSGASSTAEASVAPDSGDHLDRSIANVAASLRYMSTRGASGRGSRGRAFRRLGAAG